MDTGSADITYSDESVKEVQQYLLEDISNWFVGDKIRYFGSTDTIEWVLKSMTTA